MDLRPGTRIQDRYELIRLLGEGGQGSVWEVRDLLAGSALRALKLVRLERDDAFERARREAKILSGSRFPGLIACYAFFEDRDKRLVGLVLDHVNGTPLTEAIRGGRMSMKHRLCALHQVAETLAYVHANGLVHRDLTPRNVLITNGFWEKPDASGTVKLIDFGIAAPIGNPKPLTAPGEVLGNKRYLAPELLGLPQRSRAEEEGCKRDLFAFGVIAWELLRGEHPTRLGPSATLEDFIVFYAKVHRSSWPPRGLDRAWDDAITKCLALHPEDRLEDGAALVHILENSDRNARGSMPSAPRISTRTLTLTDPMTERASGPPMSSPRSASSVPMSPRGVHITPPAPPPQRSMSGPIWALAIAVALLAGVLAWKQLSPRPEEPDATVIPTIPQNTPGHVVPASTPGEVCCGGVQCVGPAKQVKDSACDKEKDRCSKCTSGWAYVPNACSAYLDLDRAWRLRLARVDRIAPLKGATACVRKADAANELCMDVEHAADLPSANRAINKAQGLSITTRDLVREPGLDITIRDARGNVIAHNPHAFHADGNLRNSALCIGTRFDVGSASVSFYLDGP